MSICTVVSRNHVVDVYASVTSAVTSLAAAGLYLLRKGKRIPATAEAITEAVNKRPHVTLYPDGGKRWIVRIESHGQITA